MLVTIVIQILAGVYSLVIVIAVDPKILVLILL